MQAAKPLILLDVKTKEQNGSLRLSPEIVN
jgi:hypothetical protein